MKLETLEVEVLQADIDLGEQGAPASCAIARALERIDGVGGASVDCGKIRFRYHDKHVWCKVHHMVRDFIKNFDDCRNQVKPVTFTLTMQDTYEE